MSDDYIARIEELMKIQDSGLLWDEKDQDEIYMILLSYKMYLECN